MFKNCGCGTERCGLVGNGGGRWTVGLLEAFSNLHDSVILAKIHVTDRVFGSKILNVKGCAFTNLTSIIIYLFKDRNNINLSG